MISFHLLSNYTYEFITLWFSTFTEGFFNQLFVVTPYLTRGLVLEKKNYCKDSSQAIMGLASSLAEFS